jgi:small basic protein (TIGR04137 family)
MSQHRSYGKATKVVKKRNVLKRFERIEVLKKLGRWGKDSKKVTALPKTPSLTT